MKKSILFVVPDYHCSFIYRDALRQRGWNADIFVPAGYPKNLLFNNNDILQLKKANYRFSKLYYFFYLLSLLVKYKNFIMYGGIRLLHIKKLNIERKIGKLLGREFYIDLALAKLFHKKLIYLPSGCLEIDLKINILKFDNGNICANCGWGDAVCNDISNKLKFDILREYFSLYIGYSDIISTQYKQITFKYKSIDLDLWAPSIKIPKEFKLPETENLRILHSFVDTNRKNNGKNIKGTPYIVAAIEKLRKEGYKVEYMYISDVPSKYMRFYQAQADIVVEQLVYGWWGSTGVETMALGKPVICYLRDGAKNNFFRFFPEYKELPIIEANVNNIYEILKKTVVAKEYRETKGRQSREFAESFFNVEKNVIDFENLLLNK